MFQEELVALTAPNVASLDAVIRKGDFRIVVLRAGCSYRLRLEALLARARIGRRARFSSLARSKQYLPVPARDLV